MAKIGEYGSYCFTLFPIDPINPCCYTAIEDLILIDFDRLQAPRWSGSGRRVATPAAEGVAQRAWGGSLDDVDDTVETSGSWPVKMGNQWEWGLRRILKDILPIKTGLKLLTSPESPEQTAKCTHATVWGWNLNIWFLVFNTSFMRFIGGVHRSDTVLIDAHWSTSLNQLP